MPKFTTLKTLLVGLLACAATSVWAYTPSLKNDYSIIGYKVKAYYDVANANVDNMFPTEGDLRFRGSGYGLFNFGANNRGADVTLTVSKGNLLVVEFKDTQGRNVTVNSISSCTKNDTYSGDFFVYDVTADATTVNFNIGRAGCIIALLVMEKDASVQTAGYTINYKYNGETIASDTGSDIALGTVINAAKTKLVENVKYILVDNQTDSLTIASGSNVLNVNVRLAETFSYTVKATAGNNTVELATGSVFEGETASVPYSQYMLDGNKLYNAPAQGTGDWYSKAVVPTSNEFVETITYDNPIDNVVFYSEGENIPGVSVGTNSARASFGKMGYTANSNTYVNVAVLSAGHYTIYLRGVNGNSASRTVNFKVGETVVYTYSIANGTNQLGNSVEFEVTGDAILSFASDGSSASGVDWFYIVSEDGSVKADASTSVIATIGTNRYSTFASAYPVEIPAGVTAYTAKVNEAGTVVTFTKIEGTVIPAKTGVLLEGNPGIVTLTVVESASPLTDNDFIAGTGAAPSDNTKTYFAMVKDSDPLAFGKIAAGVVVPANKAYLAVAAGAFVPESARLTVTFDGEATGIKTVENAKAGKAIYNLNGQRVDKAQKGLYIVNGKKTIVK